MFDRYSRVNSKLDRLLPKAQGLMVFECPVSYDNTEISDKAMEDIRKLSLGKEYAVVIKRFIGD